LDRRVSALVAVAAIALSCTASAARTEQEQAGSAAERKASRSARAATAVPDASYRLGPEDVVEVFVWKEEDLSTTATVRPDGRITMPLAGEIVADGKTPEELQVEIAQSLARFVTRPVVTVMVKSINSAQVSVLGEVRKPGRYRIAQRATILDAIALGGGFTEFARRDKVVVLRNGPSGVQRIPVDVELVVRHGWTPLKLEPGDTVYVE
jgi:polysaccharide export outer membrane protein